VQLSRDPVPTQGKEGKTMSLRFRTSGYEHLSFITTTVVSHLKVFAGDKYYRALIDNLNFYRDKYEFKLVAYVLMPTHVHLLLLIPSETTESDIMRDFKNYTSMKVRDLLIADSCAAELSVLKKAAIGYRDQHHKLWMDRFDNVVVYSRRMFDIKLRYIHNNPVKAGLVLRVEDWKYSSARNYLLNDHSVIRVDTDLVL
jgi:REP element-mobilizing transposase RayT